MDSKIQKVIQSMELKASGMMWPTKVLIIACGVCLLLGGFAGAYVQSHWGPRVTNTIHTKETITLPPTVVKGDTQTIHSIQYVEKEVDPKTGQKEKTDVQIDSGKPEVNVLVNGKPFDFKPTFQEGYAFENGKLVYKQNTKFDLSIDTPPPVRIPPDNVSVGAYLGKHSGGATIDIGKLGVSLGPEWKKPTELDYQVRWNFYRR